MEKEKEKVDDYCLLLLNIVLHVMTTLTLMLKFVTTHSVYGVFGLIWFQSMMFFITKVMGEKEMKGKAWSYN